MLVALHISFALALKMLQWKQDRYMDEQMDNQKANSQTEAWMDENFFFLVIAPCLINSRID